MDCGGVGVVAAKMDMRVLQITRAVIYHDGAMAGGLSLALI